MSSDAKSEARIERAARDAVAIADERDCHLRVAATYAAREHGCVLAQRDIYQTALEATGAQ